MFFLKRSFTNATFVPCNGRINISTNKGAKLLTSHDTFKDQTFFLSHVQQKALKKTIFPIGDFLKNQVRQMASEVGLHVANRPDSTGICFIGKRNFQDFISEVSIESTCKNNISIYL